MHHFSFLFSLPIHRSSSFTRTRRMKRVVLTGGFVAGFFLITFLGVGRAADAPANITVGVGSISNTYDGTSESFNFVKFLRSRPQPADGPAVEFALIDHPNDADYAVSGKVTASYGHQYRGGRFGRSAGKAHVFTYTHALDLAVWRNGKKIAVLKAEPNALPDDLPRELVQGSIETDSYDGIRMSLLQPVWQKLAARIEQQVRADLTESQRTPRQSGRNEPDDEEGRSR